MLFTTPYERLTIRRLPWVSFGLAALWLLTYGAMSVWPAAGWETLALVPAEPTAAAWGGHWLLHESWAHLAVGLVLILTLGPVLEDAWGALFTAGFLVVLLPLSAAGYLLAEDESLRGLVGASGLLAGLLAACGVRQLRDGLHYTAVGWWRGVVHTRFRVPAYVPLGVWFVGEVAMQHVDDGLGTTRGVSYAGQALGALLGAAVAHAMLRFGLEERWLDRSRARAFHPALAAAESAREASGDAAALRLLLPAHEKEPGEARLLEALCRSAVAAGEPERAVAPFVSGLRAILAADDTDAAAALFEQWSEPLSRPELGATLSVSLASALAMRSRSIEAARLLRRLLDSPTSLSTGQALRVLEVARPIHAGVAIRAAHLALEGGEFARGKREHIESLIRELEARRALELDPQLDEEESRPTAEPLAQVGSVESAALADDGPSLELASANDVQEPHAGSESREPMAERASFELGADGSLTGTGSDFELAAPEEPEPDTQPILGPTEDETDPILSQALDVAASETRFAEAKCLEVVPVALEPGRISLRQDEGRTGWLDLAQVQAIASAAVDGLAAQPVLLIDLLLNWSEVEEAPLRILRIRSDRFDPSALFPDAGEGREAFRALLSALLEPGDATPLPDPQQAAGNPFAHFERPEAYERRVLLLER